MSIKRVPLLGIIFILSLIFLGGCSITSNGGFTKPEYIKEVIVRRTKFEDITDNFLDQVDTYDDTQAAKDRLKNISEEAKNFVSNMKDELGHKVPSDCREHYNNMLAAYNLYLEGIDIYLNNLSNPLSDDRNNAIRRAEDKFQEAHNAMINL